MAGETVVLSASEISQLIQYVSAFVVAVISGLAVSLGWVKAKHIKPEDAASTTQVSTSGDALLQLTKAIQLLIDRLIEMQHETARKEKREREAIEELSDDIRRLIQYLRASLTEKGV